jgi:hypothetical protein
VHLPTQQSRAEQSSRKHSSVGNSMHVSVSRECLCWVMQNFNQKRFNARSEGTVQVSLLISKPRDLPVRCQVADPNWHVNQCLTRPRNI